MDRAGGRDPATHGVHETLGDGEAQARALAAVGWLAHAPELLEHMLELGGRDAAAFVLDRHHHVPQILIGGDLDERAIRTIGDGVLKDVHEGLFQKSGIHLHQSEPPGKIPHRLAIAEPARNPVQRRGQHITHVGEVLAGRQCAALDPGHVQQVADIAVQPFGLLADAIQQVATDLGFQLIAIVDQGGGRAQHGRERRPQVMTDGVEQGGPQPIRPAQGLGVGRLRRQFGALQRHRALIQQGENEPLVVGSGVGRRFGRRHPRPGLEALQRPEGPSGVG